MNEQQNKWNEIYRKYGIEKPVYDLWLDKYEDVLSGSKDIPIIDLGCGIGNDSIHLSERGYKVISCNFSFEALIRLPHILPA